jgi:PhoH-like ATPase
MTSTPSPAADATSTGKEMERPAVVLDTSALIDDPEILAHHPHTDVVVPLVVLEELDKLKDRDGFVARAARSAIAEIETLRLANGGDLRTAITLDNGATVRIEPNHWHRDRLEELGLDARSADNRILSVALGLSESYADVSVIASDVTLRIKASQLGLRAATSVNQVRAADSGHVGWAEIAVGRDVVDEMYARKRIDAADAEVYGIELDTVPMNTGLVLRSPNSSALVRVRPDGLALLRTQEAWGLKARNAEQRFALDLLMDQQVPIVTLCGGAGSGKTILTLAAGLEQVVEQKLYDRVMVLRPMVSVERQDTGFLPGDLADKLGPWFETVLDTMVALSEKMTHREAREILFQMTERNQLVMEPVTFLRGRSLQRTFVIADEVQNLSPLAAKTIISRIGDGSKVVLLGDPTQIDAPYLTRGSEALSATVQHLAGEDLFGWVVLKGQQRSAAAELAARKL